MFYLYRRSARSFQLDNKVDLQTFGVIFTTDLLTTFTTTVAAGWCCLVDQSFLFRVVTERPSWWEQVPRQESMGWYSIITTELCADRERCGVTWGTLTAAEIKVKKSLVLLSLDLSLYRTNTKERDDRKH